jgi:quinol monooxygenase YgiN
MIIVAGHLRVDAGDREAFVAQSCEAVVAARCAGGCLDFVVASDPVDGDRVNVFERWTDRASSHAFRASGPAADLATRIRAFSVQEFEVVPAGGAP